MRNVLPIAATAAFAGYQAVWAWGLATGALNASPGVSQTGLFLPSAGEMSSLPALFLSASHLAAAVLFAFSCAAYGAGRHHRHAEAAGLVAVLVSAALFLAHGIAGAAPLSLGGEGMALAALAFALLMGRLDEEGESDDEADHAAFMRLAAELGAASSPHRADTARDLRG
ncbi:hypothetical protein [Aureimonas mangrovi]|uniref:hypothetical protein n=1 Tax=Aureimonas mangrovi TaxID=2758041 RepID=UPI00163D6B4F|nr:hypothetical protein [Aureimonas mangrovi]